MPGFFILSRTPQRTDAVCVLNRSRQNKVSGKHLLSLFRIKPAQLLVERNQPLSAFLLAQSDRYTHQCYVHGMRGFSGKPLSNTKRMLVGAMALLGLCSAFSSADELVEQVLSDGQVASRWDVGIGAFDQAIAYESCIDDGGAQCPTVNWSWVSNPDKGTVLRATWMNNGQHAGIFFKSSLPQDLSAFAEGSLEFDVRTVKGSASLTVKVDCVWPCTSGDKRIPGPITSQWRTVSIPISTLVNGGLDLKSVDTGLVFWPADLEAIEFEIDNVVWRADEAGLDIGTLSGPDSPKNYEGFVLQWSDEFSASQLDSRFWSYNIGDSGWGNNEWQYYQRSNAALIEGYLVITARKESVGNSNYTSARIKTEGLFEFGYGRIDIRAALPRGQGIWPALWALGSNFGEVGWPFSGEIDIMEMIGGAGRENTVHGTVHWNNGGLDAPYSHRYIGGSFTGQDFSAGFNVFSIIRSADSIEWRVNDTPFYRFDIDDSGSLAPFRKPFFLIFNVAVGGNWPGYPDAFTQFPQRMIVDYVRFFAPEEAANNTDTDGDGVLDEADNCPLISNAEQADTDSDATGDACDTDDDGDGVFDEADNCPLISNADQADTDGDAQGDACDTDDDNDGVSDGDELLIGTDPTNPDTDSDGLEDGDERNLGTDPLTADSDSDSLTDGEEVGLGTDPLLKDTDGDGWPDKEEVDEGSDPLSKASQPELSSGFPIWLLYIGSQGLKSP